MIELARCAYSPLGKAFENQIKKFKEQGEKNKSAWRSWETTS